MAMRIKKNDLVEVTAGRNKGDRGRILKIDQEGGLVFVENVNVVKRHQSPKKFRQGGIIEKEAAIHISNVMLVDSKTDKRSRVRFEKDKDGVKVRVAARSGARIDNP